MLLPLTFALFAAIIPAIVYVYLIWWCDRYEREPGWLLLTAFLWGAIPAIVLSLVLELALQEPLMTVSRTLTGTTMQIVVISPVVEEVVKGLALLGLFLFFRSEIDGVLDGIVYGALVGVGFAMTENFLYLINIFTQGLSADLGLVTVMRSVVFGLNHAFYTAITGAAFGLATWAPGRLWRWLIVLSGLTLAIVVHVFHNSITVLARSYPALLLVSAAFNWGGVATLVVIIILALRLERRRIRMYLAEEVPDTLSEEQYLLVRDHPQRLGKWRARLRGEDATQAMLAADLHQKATELAFHKHRLARMGDDGDAGAATEIARLRAETAALALALSGSENTAV